MDAVIRKDGIVVRLEGIKNPIPDSDGYLVGFHSDSGSYFHYTDEGNYANYKEYVEYRNQTRDLKKVEIFNSWKIAQNGDFIKIRKREILYVSSDYNNHANDNKYKWLECEKTYSGESYSPNGIPTAGFQIKSELVNEAYFGANSTALAYFKLNIVMASVTNSEPSTNKKLIETIANITQLIKNIGDSVFKAFIEIDINNPLIKDVFINIKNQQDIFWRNVFVNVAGNHTLKELLEIYTKNYIILDQYYDQYCNFRNFILNHSDPNNSKAEDIEKLIHIAIPFSPVVLQLIPVDLKIRILKYLCSKKYINNFRNVFSNENNNSPFHFAGLFSNGKMFSGEVLEQFIVNLVYSVKATEVDEFLDKMLSTLQDGLIFTEKKTLYEVIYENLRQSYNISVGLLEFSNIIFKTDFKPTETKSAFTHAMYGLWLNSKYNPYTLDGSYKQNIFYIKSLNPTSGKPANSDKFFVEDHTTAVPPSVVYQYSYETAYQLKKNNSTNPPSFEYPIDYPDAAPITMPYASDKSIGIYFDNFSFNFKEGKIQAYQKDLPTLPADIINKYENAYKDALFGTYHIYQPVTLINNNVETKVPIPTLYGTPTQIGNGSLTINSLIPVFVLKMIDDLGDRSDVETVIGYMLDGVLTFSGIGNATKLRHLRWAAMGAETTGLLTKAGLRVVLGGIEFTSGALGFFANFVECSTNDEFCINMKNYIMLLQLATLSVTAADNITTFALKNSADKIVYSAGGATETEIIQNVKNKLKSLHPNTADDVLTEVSGNIYRTTQMAMLPTFSVVAAVRKLIEIRKFVLQPEYTDAILTTFINFCRTELRIKDDILIEDFLVTANRGKKPIEYTDLRTQVNYYINEVVKRGFPAGFLNKANYRAFCQESKSFFIESLNKLNDEFIAFEDKFEFYVKGSAVRAPKTINDPNINNVELPIWRADDIDIDIMLDANDYNDFCRLMNKYIKDLKKRRIINSDDYDVLAEHLKGGDFLTYQFFELLPIGNSNFTKGFRNSCQQYTEFIPVNGKEKINFAIVKKNKVIKNERQIIDGKIIGKYDMKPKLPYID